MPKKILEFGRAVRPYLGVALAPATLARRLGIKGVVVLGVAPGGPAAAAGVRPSSRCGEKRGRGLLCGWCSVF
jgi:S1-C subfamily serine protease